MQVQIKEQMESHNHYLSDFATLDNEAVYFQKEEEDLRTSFFHDIDRIIYSLSFIRYQDKTQVFSEVTHDHVSKRMIHVQFVSKIARTIGRALGLNEDLIEASALAHDLGHTPFGHNGEAILSKLSEKHHEGYFNHNIQSVRNLMYVENYGKGLNISLQVLDAVMCHNGEFTLNKLDVNYKTKEEFLKEYRNSYQDKDFMTNLKPMTLEGCVVRISDMIAYLGRDIDDAIRLNLIKREDIPKSISNILGTTTKEIVNTCILDIINNSYQKNYILMSEKVYNALNELKKFNYNHIYNKSMSKQDINKLTFMFETLFDTYLQDIKKKNSSSPIINSYLNNMVDSYKKNNTKERIVIDYIAGMTDDFFFKEYERISEKVYSK